MVPDNVKATSDVINGFRNIDYVPFQGSTYLGHGSGSRDLTMTEYLIEVSGSLPPLQGSCTVADWDRQSEWNLLFSSRL